jgi:hypothetical protein
MIDLHHVLCLIFWSDAMVVVIVHAAAARATDLFRPLLFF